MVVCIRYYSDGAFATGAQTLVLGKSALGTALPFEVPQKGLQKQGIEPKGIVVSRLSTFVYLVFFVADFMLDDTLGVVE